MLLRIIEPGLPPELPGDLNGVDADRLPPGLLVAGAMDRPVMRAAERDGEFVARFAAERPWLQVTKMMRIGLFAAADEACLLGDVAQVLSVAIAARCGNREDALVNASGLITSGIGSLRLRLRRDVERRGTRFCRNLVYNERWEVGQFLLERFLEKFRIGQPSLLLDCHRARLLPPSLPLRWSAVEHRHQAHQDHPRRRCQRA